ncbi:hypothetical protein OPS25_14550 [Alteromonas ponticola]|uniref:DUF4440 domain-containing protein n=1 Tax=Alteromonas aquimaris TaxID=2998417 RepID=A0ABT3PAB1_9ALTE|nr:hypothetical protein [Alteromonas aquimaris]MCW8109723.1 hypothetical protein [Alteromonas aquimaris]
MKYHHLKVVAFFAAASIGFTTSAQQTVTAQIHTSLLAEQAAFGKNCAEASSYLSGKINWHVEGAVKSKSELVNLCHFISQKKGMPPRKLIDHKLTELSAVSGFSVSTYSVGKHAEKVQVVTKIWNKVQEQWQVVHAQESTSVKKEKESI